MLTETKKSTTLILIIVMLVAVLCSAGASVFTAKAVMDLKTEAAAEDETREDDVPIMDGEYRILSTAAISDAYKSGSDAGLDERQKETLTMASDVLKEIITDDMTDYEKEKAVYDWMTHELRYDTGVLQVIPATGADADNPYGVLKYHNAVCVGYATTFRLFMQMMDIECMVVHNTEKYHSWDLVKLDDDWYHVDIYSDQDSGNYANFNMNDERASMGHDWDRDFFPAATGTQYNYAYQNKTPVSDIYQVPQLVRQAIENQDGLTSLSFEVIDEPHAQQVETMLNSIQSLMSEDETMSDLWMEWSWMHVSGTEYILAIYIDGFTTEEEDPAYDISEEDQEKIQSAIDTAFGTDLDWSEIESTMEESNDTEMAETATEAAG